MADETGRSSVYTEHQLSHGRATKRTHGSLIERLRHKNSLSHSWTDSIKSVRNSVTERKTQAENTEPSGVQECLDTLQKAMKVKTQQTLKERLDLIGRHLGLNTEIQEQKVSLGTDTFQVDVLLGDGGSITNVKLANQGDIVDCPDLKDILKKGDFSEFIEHLQGLQSIYQVTNDEKLKTKAFLALQALEKDLNQLAQFQSSISGVANYIHKCPLGIMLPRLAGKPMKLIYFVSPYDLLDKKSLAAHPLTVEAITENFLGQSVTVCIEPVSDSAPANKLQTMPLMNVNKTHDGKSLPSFSAVSKMNSMMLPASFVLVLPQGVPVSTLILQKITSQTNLEIHKEADVQSLRSLILETFSGGNIKDYRRLHVSLPDQQHIYFLDCLNGSSQEHQGVMVSRIPFTHPTHVPQILNLMRQQLLFNIVIGSLVRPGAKKESANSIVFEVTTISLQQLTIVFEHPVYDSLIRVDVDLSDITNLRCKVACPNSDQILCSDEAISRVFHRCMSIPIMLRWLIVKGQGQLDKLKEVALAAKKEILERALILREMQQQQVKLLPAILPTNRPPPQPPHPPPLPPPPSYSHHHSPVHLANISNNGPSPTISSMLSDSRGISYDELHYMTERNGKHINDRLILSPDPENHHNPLLTTLLDDEELPGNQKEVHDSPMLIRLLDDNTSVATNVIPMNCKPSQVAVKRQRKRRSQSDFSGPGSKHRFSDSDLTERFGPLSGSVDRDMGSGLIDQSLHNTTPVMRSMTPTHSSSGVHHHPVLNRVANSVRSQNNVIDLTVDSVGESSLKKLVDSVDKHFIHKDVKTEQDLSMLLNESEIQNRIPSILHNSPSGSKNENASTSLEGILKGSGEVGRAKDLDPGDALPVHSSTTVSKLSSLLLATSDSPSPHLGVSSHKANHMFLNDKPGIDEPFSAGTGKSVPNSVFLEDVIPSPAQQTICQSPGFETNDKKGITGIFEKFDISRQQKNMKIEVVNSEVKSQATDGKVSLRLRVGPLKQQNSNKPFVKSFHPVDEADLLYSKPNSIGAFDFKSDEDDDDPPMQFPSDKCVYSSSPTRLQISRNKHKHFKDYTSAPQKLDKVKKKDKSSGNNTKRKREKDESRREKKRKKSEHFIQESVYRTVENDSKANFKFKIRVAKKPVADKSGVLSDAKVPSYEIAKKPLDSFNDKLPSVKEESKEVVPVVNDTTKEKESESSASNAHKNVQGKPSVPGHKSLPKSAISKLPQGSSSNNKADPKLVTKATIRLKPLTMPNSSSTINIGQSVPKSSSTGAKTERRGSISVTTPVLDKHSSVHNFLERRSSTSNLLDRRGATQFSPLSSSLSLSTSALPTTTAANMPITTAPSNLSISSILPNVPSVSKIAGLPRIPKLSSSSPNTSISRTSSLGPGSESSPTSAGTKSNNSYTIGPAGRVNPGTTSTPGGNRSSGNYGSRPAVSGNGGSGNNWSNLSSRKSGLANHQTSPLINSSQGGQLRPTGPRTHNSTVVGVDSYNTGNHTANRHKNLGNITNNAMKGSVDSSNSPQKIISAKPNSNISSKANNHFLGQKLNTSTINSTSTQKNAIQNVYPTNSVQINSTSCNINKSPNLSGLTKSPNSGRSPNITNSSRSPNITNSSRSPSLANSNRSPNISTANKSPNLSSSTSGRSPNVHPNRLHNATTNPVRTAQTVPDGKPANLLRRHSPSVTKTSGINKSILKTRHTSSSQRTHQNSSYSIDTSPGKTRPKTMSVSSNDSQTCDDPGPVPAAHDNHISGDATSIIFSPPSAFEPVSTMHTSLATQPQTSTVSFPEATTPSLITAVSVNNLDQAVPSKVNVAVEETTTVLLEKVSTPVTPSSADMLKNKLNSLSKGRKNSLSAIVDKLKHNAVGVVLDAVTDSQKSVNSKACLDDVKPLLISSHLLPQDERSRSSELPSGTVQSVLGAETAEKTTNKLLQGINTKMVYKAGGSSSIILSSTKLLHSEAESARKSVNLFHDHNQEICNRPHDVSLSAEAMPLLHPPRLKDDSGKEEPSDITNYKPCIRSKEKPMPQLHLLKSSNVSSVQNSGDFTSKTPASPQVLLESPRSISTVLPVVHHGDTASQDVIKEVLRRPPVKSSVDFCNEDFPSDLRTNKIDRVVRTAKSVDNQTTILKPASSPLSDISSPASGLVIDDDELMHISMNTSNKVTVTSSGKAQSLNVPREEHASSISQSSVDKTDNIPNTFNCLPPRTSSPKTSRPPSAKSPTLAKNPSGASTPKDSESPCPIDDDLMDMALGFDN